MRIETYRVWKTDSGKKLVEVKGDAIYVGYVETFRAGDLPELIRAITEAHAYMTREPIQTGGPELTHADIEATHA